MPRGRSWDQAADAAVLIASRARAVADAARAQYHHEKVERFRELLPGVDRAAAGELLLTIVSLVNAWPVLGHLDAFLVDGGPDRAARRRAVLVASATALAREAISTAASAA